MSRMGHAEAHERIVDLALEPAALAALADEVEGRSGVPAAGSARHDLDGLAEHVATCPRCRLQLNGWRATHRALDLAVAPVDAEHGPARLDDLAHDPMIPAPPALRDRILSTASASPARVAGTAGDASDVGRARADRVSSAGPTGSTLPTPEAGRRPWSFPTLLVRRVLPIAAAVAILVGALAFAQQASRLDATRSEVAALEGVTMVLDRLLRDPDHHVVALAAADGSARGSLAWSSRDLVVMTSALDRPPAGQTYRCWVERDGVRTPVGEMWFAGRLAYWTGSLDEWATISLDKAGRFGVSLVSDTKGASSDPVLVATLPG